MGFAPNQANEGEAKVHVNSRIFGKRKAAYELC